MNWKIERDHFFGEIYQKTNDLNFLENAGFFFDSSEDNHDIKDDLDIMCTPINFLLPKLKDSKNPAIILTTGSMCPIHDGHVEMMINAKNAVEQAGYDVIGGYISPDHDEYIFSKVKKNPIPIHQRIHLINKAIKDIDWITVDPYNGVFCKVAVNYTDIVYRMKLYIEKHLGREIPIFFVCGGDNARFASAFGLKGHCVVVGRPGNEEKCMMLSTLRSFNSNILYIEGKNDNSSTKVRETFKYEFNKKKLSLRVWDKPCEELTNILSEYFTEIRHNSISEQKDKIQEFSHNLISMDSQIPVNYQFQISRKYDLFGIKQLGFTNRPETKSLNAQAQSIPKEKSFVLYDDDIHTGNTMKCAKKILEDNGVKIDGVFSFTITENSDEEILDERDFFIEDKNSGLLIELPNGEISRVPYIYPYVDPFIRGSINNPAKFSKDIWEYNFKYYKDKNTTLGDLNHLRIFFYIGFNEDDKISDICLWHLNLFDKTK